MSTNIKQQKFVNITPKLQKWKHFGDKVFMFSFIFRGVYIEQTNHCDIISKVVTIYLHLVCDNTITITYIPTIINYKLKVGI